MRRKVITAGFTGTVLAVSVLTATHALASNNNVADAPTVSTTDGVLRLCVGTGHAFVFAQAPTGYMDAEEIGQTSGNYTAKPTYPAGTAGKTGCTDWWVQPGLVWVHGEKYADSICSGGNGESANLPKSPYGAPARCPGKFHHVHLKEFVITDQDGHASLGQYDEPAPISYTGSAGSGNLPTFSSSQAANQGPHEPTLEVNDGWIPVYVMKGQLSQVQLHTTSTTYPECPPSSTTVCSPK
jgi:hypothetical protein